MQLVYMYMDSPVGALKLVAHDQALVAVMWDNEDHKREIGRASCRERV